MGAAQRERLDLLLVERGLAPTREKAQALIMAGRVRVDGRPGDKAGVRIPSTAVLEIDAPEHAFASRGGLKLEKALDAFSIRVDDRLCLDVGASTGGFTDCLLQRGAHRVYAVDVGYGQLAYTLRQDPRVVVLERVNARYLSEEHVPEKAGFACLDVSFISLALVLPAVVQRLADSSTLVALVKPQFEAGRADVGRGGVVRTASVHARVLREILRLARELGLVPKGLTWSPVRGPAGNIEFLLWMERGGESAGATALPGQPSGVGDAEVEQCVAQAHAAFDEAKSAG